MSLEKNTSNEKGVHETNIQEESAVFVHDGANEKCGSEVTLDLVPKDTGWAWMCCLGCFVTIALTAGGVFRCFSIMYVAFMEEFDAKAGHAAWVVALINTVQTLGGSVCMAMSIRFTNQAVVVVGGLILCTGFVSSMLATTVYHLYFTYGFLLGIGSACTYYISMAHLGLYFKKRRALANGLALSGTGIGGFVLPVVYRFLLDTYGLQGALLVMGGIALNTCVAGMLLRPLSFYSTAVTKTKKIQKQYERKSNLSHHKRCSPLPFFVNIVKIYTAMEWSLLKKLSFALYGVTGFFFLAAYPLYYTGIAAYVEEMGHSKTDAAYIVSIGSVADIFGRIVTGFVADFHFIPTYTLMGLLALVASLLAAVLPFLTNLMLIGVVHFIFTLACGSVIPLNPVFLGETFGAQRLSSALGIIVIFMGIGGLIGTPIGGTLRDITGNWRASFLFASACLMVTALTLLMRPLIHKLGY